MKQTGISLASVLGVVFIVLKLCNLIGWSWWWVLAPFWIPFGLAILFVGILLLANWVEERGWE